VLAGDKPGARKAFFALSQHADHDIPVLRQANAEYRKLPWSSPPLWKSGNFGFADRLTRHWRGPI
jgi:hypothetical protein